jgi:2-polyprenyl-3-methyl-5-hydroxy-6-metoxy-1,4-benzoquinol methylase
MVNPFINTSKAAQTATADNQHRNRNWWQAKPMTYADWSADDREPRTDNDFLKMEEYVLRTGPWLKTWFKTIDFNGLRCLDLGSGSGIFSSMLGRRGALVTAMDLTEAAVNLTRKTATFFGCHVSSVRCDAEYNPFGNDTFDFIFSWGVLHHTHDMDTALKEVSRILKPGGRGMMMVYHRRSVVYYVHGFYWLLAKGKIFSGHSLRSVQDFYTDGFYHRYMTPVELETMLEKSGLRVRKFSVTQYEKKILPFIPSRLDEWLKARFGMCLIAEFEKSVD